MNTKTMRAAAMAVLLSIGNLFAQTHDVSLNVAPIMFGNFSGNYSYNFASDMSVGTVVGYQNIEVSDGLDNKVSYGGYYVAPEFRYFFNPERANDGFFTGGYLKYRDMGTTGNAYEGIDVNGDLVSYDIKSKGLAMGLTFGKIWSTRRGFIFSIWSGLGYYLFDTETYTNNFKPDPTLVQSDNLPALDFRFGINVGYRIGN